MIVSIWGNVWRLSAGKKSASSFSISLNYFFIAKILWTSIGYFGNDWLCTLNLILSSCRKRLCLSAEKNQLCLPCFEKDCQHFGLLLEKQNFTKYGMGDEISASILAFISDYFQEKLITKKSPQKYLGASFDPFCTNLVKN